MLIFPDPSTFISTLPHFGWQPIFISTCLKPFTLLMMCNYLGVCVRWKLISPCQGCWQAWHEFSCPGPTVCHLSETLWVDIHSVGDTKWQSSAVNMTLWLFFSFHPPKESATMHSKCKLEVSLLCGALTEHWHCEDGRVGGDGWKCSFLVNVINSCMSSIIIGIDQLLQQNRCPCLECKTEIFIPEEIHTLLLDF